MLIKRNRFKKEEMFRLVPVAQNQASKPRLETLVCPYLDSAQPGHWVSRGTFPVLTRGWERERGVREGCLTPSFLIVADGNRNTANCEL